MLRTIMFVIACFAALALPAAADTQKTEPTPADLVAADPLVTDSATGKTTYFGDPKPQSDKLQPGSAAAKPPAPPALPPTIIAKINLARQQMVVSVNGVQRYVWPISSGVSQFPTPTGTFRPQWTSPMWYSRKYDWAPMPSAVFISGGVAVHGTSHTGALGSPASHGCIRLSTANARTFYNLVERHGLKMTRVVVFGRPNWGDQVAVGRSGNRKKVYADNRETWSADGWSDDAGVFAPSGARRKGQGTYVFVDGVPRKVYRRSNGDVGLTDRPRRGPAYRTYGYGYGPDY